MSKPGRVLFEYRLVVVGIEPSGLRASDPARDPVREMGKSPDSITRMVTCIVRRRSGGPDLRSTLDHLDRTIATDDAGERRDNGGTA